MNDDNGLRFVLATLKPGSVVKARIWRDNREMIFNITAETPKEVPIRDERDINGYHPLDGMTVVNLSPALAEEINVDPYLRGVMITGLRSRSAARANGFRPGDIILTVKDKPVATTRQLTQILDKDSDVIPDDWQLEIDRNGRIYQVPTRYMPRKDCLLYTSPSPRDQRGSRMPSSA